METQAAISAAKLARKVGRTLEVLVDEVVVEGRAGNKPAATAIARSHADAPEIDGIVRVKKAKGAAAGDLLRVTVTAADAHDLDAVPA
jgi:ribosomal protein S12 methylthiotransferase